MAPKKRTTVSEDKVVSSILLHTDPMWDSSPIRLPGWFTLLLKDITNENAAFDSLLKYGYVFAKKTISFANAYILRLVCKRRLFSANSAILQTRTNIYIR